MKTSYVLVIVILSALSFAAARSDVSPQRPASAQSVTEQRSPVVVQMSDYAQPGKKAEVLRIRLQACGRSGALGASRAAGCYFELTVRTPLATRTMPT